MENQNITSASAQNDDRPQGLPEPIYASSGDANNQQPSGNPNHSDHAARNRSQMGGEPTSPRATGVGGNPDNDGGDDAMDDDIDDAMDDDMPDSENPDRPDRPDQPGQPMA